MHNTSFIVILIADEKGGANPGEKEPGLEDMQAKNEDIRWGPNRQKSNLEIEEKSVCGVVPCAWVQERKKRQTYP